MRGISKLHLEAEISKKLGIPAYESPQKQVVRINRTRRAEGVVKRRRLSSVPRTRCSFCPMSSQLCQKRAHDRGQNRAFLLPRKGYLQDALFAANTVKLRRHPSSLGQTFDVTFAAITRGSAFAFPGAPP